MTPWLSDLQEGRVNYYDLNRLDDPNPTFKFQAHTGQLQVAYYSSYR
jgi:hypothetical protein